MYLQHGLSALSRDLSAQVLACTQHSEQGNVKLGSGDNFRRQYLTTAQSYGSCEPPLVLSILDAFLVSAESVLNKSTHHIHANYLEVFLFSCVLLAGVDLLATVLQWSF